MLDPLPTATLTHHAATGAISLVAVLLQVVRGDVDTSRKPPAREGERGTIIPSKAGLYGHSVRGLRRRPRLPGVHGDALHGRLVPPVALGEAHDGPHVEDLPLEPHPVHGGAPVATQPDALLPAAVQDHVAVLGRGEPEVDLLPELDPFIAARLAL